MRTLLIVLSTTLAVSLGAGCRRGGAPSPEYAEASGLHDHLLAELDGDEAYGDPKMQQVEALLAKVRDDSSDKAAATALAEKIRAGKERLQKSRESAPAQGNADVAAQFKWGLDKPGDQAQAAEAPDAGPSQPATDMALSEFRSRFSGCFEEGPRLLVSGVGMRDTYQLKAIASCRDRHPAFDQLFVLIDQEKVSGFAQRTGARMALLDGGTPPEQTAQAPEAAQPAAAPNPEPDRNVTAPAGAPGESGQREYGGIKY